MPSYSAYLIEGTPLAWPSTKAEMQAKLGGETFKQTQSQTDTLYFSPKSAELPLTTTFLDGIGVTHTVTLTTKGDEVHVLVPPTLEGIHPPHQHLPVNRVAIQLKQRRRQRPHLNHSRAHARRAHLHVFGEGHFSQSWHPRKNRSVLT